MAVDHALGVAGRAGRVAHARRRVLVDLAPAIVAVSLVEPLLEGDPAGRGRGRHAGAIGHDDDLLDALDGGKQLLGQRSEGQVDEQHPIFGVVHDPGDLLREQARIERMVDRADAHDPVPGLQVAGGVPAQRRDAVADAVAFPVEALRRPEGALPERGIGGAHDRPLHRARHDLPVAVLARRMIEDLVAQQRPFLHQPEHGSLPCFQPRHLEPNSRLVQSPRRARRPDGGKKTAVGKPDSTARCHSRVEFVINRGQWVVRVTK